MKKNIKKGRKTIIASAVLVLISLSSLSVYAKHLDKMPTIRIVEHIPYTVNMEEVDILKKEEVVIEETKAEVFSYNEQISMPKEHQEYLYNKCKERKLDYLKTLAIISLESNFNNNLVSKTNDYGYMQINRVNHSHLTKTLGTKNSPLDPYVNIDWGTYMLGDLYQNWRGQGISEEAKSGETFSELDKYVMSSYNKGVGGFKKYGMATKYIGLIEDRYKELPKL